MPSFYHFETHILCTADIKLATFSVNTNKAQQSWDRSVRFSDFFFKILYCEERV